jgi:hypothetical protein
MVCYLVCMLCLLLHLLVVSERNVGPHESMYGPLRGGPEALLWQSGNQVIRKLSQPRLSDVKLLSDQGPVIQTVKLITHASRRPLQAVNGICWQPSANQPHNTTGRKLAVCNSPTRLSRALGKLNATNYLYIEAPGSHVECRQHSPCM